VKYKYSIGAFEAKTHLSRLLEEAEQGYQITITKRGKPVARLIPYQSQSQERTKDEIVKALKELRQKVEGKINVREMIREGRKY